MGPGVATPLKMGVVTVNDKHVNRRCSSHLIGLSLCHSTANVYSYYKQRLENQLMVTLLMKTLEILWYLSQMFHLRVA